mmetsp:Transcript_80952/g.262199  ORF Transcript_80952/g.262199 Transcript_80952/m.262199 type:complete len:396 (+) Transcript_80952:355-1542(+)
MGVHQGPGVHDGHVLALVALLEELLPAAGQAALHGHPEYLPRSAREELVHLVHQAVAHQDLRPGCEEQVLPQPVRHECQQAGLLLVALLEGLVVIEMPLDACHEYIGDVLVLEVGVHQPPQVVPVLCKLRELHHRHRDAANEERLEDGGQGYGDQAREEALWHVPSIVHVRAAVDLGQRPPVRRKVPKEEVPGSLRLVLVSRPALGGALTDVVPYAGDHMSYHQECHRPLHQRDAQMDGVGVDLLLQAVDDVLQLAQAEQPRAPQDPEEPEDPGAGGLHTSQEAADPVQEHGEEVGSQPRPRIGGRDHSWPHLHLRPDVVACPEGDEDVESPEDSRNPVKDQQRGLGHGEIEGQQWDHHSVVRKQDDAQYVPAIPCPAGRVQHAGRVARPEGSRG